MLIPKLDFVPEKYYTNLIFLNLFSFDCQIIDLKMP